MKKYSYLIIIVLISSLVLTGCTLLSNIGQVPSTGQKGIPLSTANLVALWHFDENSGTTAYDSTDNSNDGMINGASLIVDGKLGNALSFDGNDYVMISNSSSLEPSEITVEAWVKRNGSPGSCKYIVSKYLPDRIGSYSSYGLYTGSGGIRFYIGHSGGWIGSPQASASIVWNGDWHHVAGTYDGSAVKLYVDGEPVVGAGSTTSDIYYEGTGNLYIGAYTDSSYLAFSGTIDEVRIWDGALTAGEIMYSYEDNTLHVDDDWLQWPGAYRTINEALVVAVDGDTIIVHEGTYYNDILDGSSYRIDKSVTLLGAQAGVDPQGSTTDRGGETILVRTNGLPYSLYASDIIIDGFMFGSSDPDTGGRLIISDVADNAIIRNCIIQNTPSGSSGHGVYIYPGADNALVEYNTFYNTAWEAIASSGASNAVISHNHISASGQHAIQWMNHAGSNNEISYNHISGIVGKNAIQYWGGSGATISYNVIAGGNTMYDGIWLDAAADNSAVSYNQISDTVYAGINVRGNCTGATVTDNELSGCGTGIEIHAGDITGVSVNCNKIAGNIWGIRNYDTGLLDAECNWWGAHDGPSGEGHGTGDAVSLYVDFDPWLGDPMFEPITIIPVALGTETKLAAFFTGPTGGTATIDWDDGAADDPATVDDSDGVVTGSHEYTSTGVYTVTVTLTIANDCIFGIRTDEEEQFAVVYDSSEGFVTGGGWIDSPEGAYLANSGLTGKATFGFVSKYKKGATVPTGNTEFQFKAGDLSFHSDSYDWLVVTGSDYAKFKGTGTINGSGEYKFMIWAGDGGKDGEDTFRIKIWEEDEYGLEDVVYDNGMDQVIDSGSIVVHTK